MKNKWECNNTWMDSPCLSPPRQKILALLLLGDHIHSSVPSNSCEPGLPGQVQSACLPGLPSSAPGLCGEGNERSGSVCEGRASTCRAVSANGKLGASGAITWKQAGTVRKGTWARAPSTAGTPVSSCGCRPARAPDSLVWEALLHILSKPEASFLFTQETNPLALCLWSPDSSSAGTSPHQKPSEGIRMLNASWAASGPWWWLMK